MKAWVQTAVARYSEQDLSSPQPSPGELILRMRAALTCGTDLKLLSRGHSWIAPPITMGHEMCGEVIALGEGANDFVPGERVVPGISGPCGRCEECVSGRKNVCRSPERFWGAFAEFVRVPAGVPDEVAAFTDPLASILHGWKRLGPDVRDLLVFGVGAIALLWADVA